MYIIQNVEDAKKVAGFLNQYDILGIGIDTRDLSRKFKNKLLNYLKPAVIDFRIITTPMAFFASIRKNIPVAMITGSSLSRNITGIKFIFKNNVIEIFPKESDYYNEEKKDVMVLDIKPIYLNAIKGKFHKFDYTIKFDPNGGSGIFLIPLLNELFNEVNEINKEIGKFNHELTVELTKLTNFNEDFYIVLDPDADQIGIYTKERFLNYKLLTFLFVELMCKDEDVVVVNKDFPENVIEILKERVRVVKSENPHKEAIRLKAKFYCDKYKFGFKTWYYIPDGIHTFLILLKYLKKKNKDLNDVIKEYDTLLHRKT